MMTKPNIPVEERFWAKVDKAGECWVWTACRLPAGYGQFNWNGRKVYTHRKAYEMLVGPIWPGLHIDHLCRNRACCNPAHLEPVTCAENLRRGEAGKDIRSAQASSARRKASKPVCKNGHPFSEANTISRQRDGGGRGCRQCQSDYQKRLRRRRREHAAEAR